jgi:hypothetical protein
MKITVFWYVGTNFLEEYATSIFKIEDEAA